MIAWFAVSRGGGCPLTCPACDADPCGSGPTPTPPKDSEGRPIFTLRDTAFFKLVVEVRKPTASSPALDETLLPSDPAVAPGLQLLTNKRLGPVDPPPEDVDCRSGLPEEDWGGIPASPDLEYDGSQARTDALTDFACRFQIRRENLTACTLDNLGNNRFMNPGGTSNSARQYCYDVNSKAAFADGEDTILRARATDNTGKAGTASEIVIRIVP